MLIEIIGSLGAAGLLTYTLVEQNASLTDAGKIQRVANNCGLTITEKGRKQTIHLLRKSRHAWGSEYVYRIPLGLSFDDVQRKKSHIEDGLNHKRGVLDLTLDDFLSLNIKGDLLTQIRRLLTSTKHYHIVINNNRSKF